MNHVLTHVLNVLILIFMLSALLEAGLGLTIGQIVRALRNIRLVISAAVASYVVAPVIAIILSTVFLLEEHLKIGLVLFSMTAGAEPAPLAVGFAKGNVGLAVGLLVVQLGVTTFYVPLLLTQFLPEVHLDRVGLLIKLAIAVGGPICLGLFLKARHEKVADRFKHYVHKISLVFTVLVFALILILNYGRIVRVLGSGAIIAAVILIAASLLVGYLLGGSQKSNRRAVMIMTGLRNSTMALMIGSQAFDDPDELIMLVVAAVAQLFLVVPLCLYLGRRTVGR